MSPLTVLQHLNSPYIVLGAGAAAIISIPTATSLCMTTGMSYFGLLQLMNVAAYAINCASVSVPGRIDGQAQDTMQGKLMKDQDRTYQTIYSPKQGRSLVAPAGWAFAIWGPIYIGEAVFCTALSLKLSDSIVSTLPEITAPFVAANLCQSLWCVAFRPSYMTTTSNWEKYVSVAMLGGTAYSLSLIHATAAATTWYFVPLTMHFGWTTAATLVNLNGSVAMSDTSDTTVIAVGHTSALFATILGVAVTLSSLSPVYGLTVAWALSACGDGMRKRLALQENPTKTSSELARGMKVQQYLCYSGSGICAVSALATYLLK